MIQIKSALLSTFYKEGLHIVVEALDKFGIELISTGGTLKYLNDAGYKTRSVEDLTQFPEILGGRVKTLHPKVFGGILNRRDKSEDQSQVLEFNIASIDLVVVNLYPFDETVLSGESHDEIIEKIDIGGVSLIRAAAKNYQDVVILADPSDYQFFANELLENNGFITLKTRKYLAAKAFLITSTYDASIRRYLMSLDEEKSEMPELWIASAGPGAPLRYGENPHQKASFYGNLKEVFQKIQGKELSYNNLVDASACCDLLAEFGSEKPATVIIKHTNACGVAVAETLHESYSKALSCDPLSAFGGVIGMNQQVDEETATLIQDLFFEILVAPDFSKEALEILYTKKNRILLRLKEFTKPEWQIKSLFNGLLVQQADSIIANPQDCTVVTEKIPSDSDWRNMIFANKIVKHTKSNTIVLAKDGILLASGTGQTSRIDALKQAIQKATEFGFSLKGAGMASDAFFPFPDCVEIAAEAGISSVIQPGGSIKDADSVAACNRHGITMVTSGLRHFKH
jgi:phosphoribosylaminoimidazolecarboxamide formyltransferase / IMP cyclohydrolase